VSRKKGKKVRIQKPPEPLLEAPVSQIIQELGPDAANWDATIIGDGSGSTWDGSCGWASVIVDKHSGVRKAFKGAMTPGTSFLGEIFAYIQPLLWYSRNPGRHYLRKAMQDHAFAQLKVNIITDSETLARQGRGLYSRGGSQPLWQMIDSIASEGYSFRWFWIRRDRTGLNMLVDHLSRMCRKAVEDVSLPEGTKLEDFNPDVAEEGSQI
jgi:hypothetical protein